MEEKTTDQVRTAGRRYVEQARREGLSEVTIVAGDVVRELRLTYRVPSVCSALASKRFLEENSLTLERREGPPSGVGTTTKYTYKLKDADKTKPKGPTMWDLYGAWKGMWDDEGGGEAWLKAERAAWEDE